MTALKRATLSIFALLAFASQAYAQSTAQPVLPGMLVSSGCPPGYTSCYVPYSNANPLPVTGGGGGTSTANQGTPNAGGATNSWPVQGAGVAGTPAGGVVSVQGVSGGTPQPANTTQIGGNAVSTGTGASGTGTQRVVTSTDSTIGVEGQDGSTQASTSNPVPDNIAQLNGAAPSLTNPIYTANAEAADVSGTFTNGTQTTSITNTSADGYAAGLISINGTYGTASGVFEASDDAGTTWYSVVCGRSDGTASETGYTSLTNTNRQWSCPVGGNDSIRIRSTAVASGTVNVRVGISAPPPSSTVTTGNVNVNGTGTSATAAGGSLSVNPDSVVDGTTTTASVTSATTVLTFSNLQGYGYISFGFTSGGTGNTIVVDQAADGSTFNAAASFWRVDSVALSGAQGSQASPTTAMQFVVPVTAQAMRIRVQTYGSGTVTAYGTLKRGAIPGPYNLNNINGTLVVTGNVNSGSADSGAPVKTGGKYTAGGVSLADGNRGDTQLAINGATLNRPFATASNEWSYAAAAGGISNTTTAVTIKAADATRKNCISSVQLMSGALGAATEVAIRDGAGGTVLWRGFLSTAGLGSDNVQLDVPVCNASANTLLEAVTLTATITGAVYLDAQGFLTP